MPYIPSKRTRCVLRQLQVRGTDTVADRWFGSTSPAKGNSNHMHSLVSDTVSLNLSTVSVEQRANRFNQKREFENKEQTAGKRPDKLRTQNKPFERDSGI